MMIFKTLIINRKYIAVVIIFSFIVLLLNMILSLLLIKYKGVSLGREGYVSSTVNTFIMAMIIAPVFETLFFQLLIIFQTYESYSGIYKKQIAVVISAVVFGLAHFYSFYYFIAATCTGLLLAYSFCYYKEKINFFSATFYTIIIHSLSNFYVFIIKIFELI